MVEMPSNISPQVEVAYEEFYEYSYSYAFIFIKDTYSFLEIVSVGLSEVCVCLEFNLFFFFSWPQSS